MGNPSGPEAFPLCIDLIALVILSADIELSIEIYSSGVRHGIFSLSKKDCISKVSTRDSEEYREE